MAQLVKRPTLDFRSGHDLMVHEFEPHVGLCADGAEPAWDSLSPLSLSLSCSFSLSLTRLKFLLKMNDFEDLYYSFTGRFLVLLVRARGSYSGTAVPVVGPLNLLR